MRSTKEGSGGEPHGYVDSFVGGSMWLRGVHLCLGSSIGTFSVCGVPQPQLRSHPSLPMPINIWER